MPTSIDSIARAVMYEGYILYPYRPSVKNRQRWTFGGLFPRAYVATHPGADNWFAQTECLLLADEDAALDIRVRFLHPLQRTVGELPAPLDEWPATGEPEFRPVASLRVGDSTLHTWQETTERAIEIHVSRAGELADQSYWRPFALSSWRALEPIRAAKPTAGSKLAPGRPLASLVPAISEKIVAVLLREQQPIAGHIEISAEPIAAVDERLHRLRVRVCNGTRLANATTCSRDEASACSLLATHTILHATGGRFISLTDPPPALAIATTACQNIGAWPVLVGEEGSSDAILSAPIILYDYPQVAPESPGDLCDGTEIDEILSLRVLTLTDEERRTAAELDDHSRAIVERTERLARGELLALHGKLNRDPPLPQRG
jgi:hydrogenase maturation protease